MTRKLFRWMGRHRLLTGSIFATALVVATNVIAFNHAWSMTHFSPRGVRTANPESLSFVEKIRVSLVGVNLPRPANRVDPSQSALPFQTHRFGGRGGELEGWYVAHVQPKGLVLMAHGYGASKASLLGPAKAFHELGYSAFLFDFRGSGGSRGSATSIGFYEADDLAAAAEHAQTLLPGAPLILYGQSMGSVAILRAIAIQGVPAAAVIVECPFDRMLATAENRFAAMGLPAFPFAQLLVFWGGAQQGFNGFRHNPVDYARQVRVPVLHLQGADDARVTVAQARSVFEELGGEKTFVLFHNVGHESYLAAAPSLWSESVTRFLARVESRDRVENDGKAAGANIGVRDARR